MNGYIIRIGSVLLVVCVVAFFNWRKAMPQSSANYMIKKSVVDQGGVFSQTMSHKMTDAVGQPSAVEGAISTDYIVSSGFWGDGNRITSVDDLEKTEIPTSFTLYQNYPNPFNSATTIEFALPKSAFVTLQVYNLLGEKVATLVAEQQAAGIHKLNWDASGLASGLYFYKLEAGEYVQAKKLILMR